MSEHFLIDPRFDPYRTRFAPERAEVLPRITYLAVDAIGRSVPRVLAGIRSLVSALSTRLRQFEERRAAVAELSRLDDRLLRDIGVSRAELETAVLGRPPSREIETTVVEKPAAKSEVAPADGGFVWRKAA